MHKRRVDGQVPNDKQAQEVEDLALSPSKASICLQVGLYNPRATMRDARDLTIGVGVLLLGTRNRSLG